MKRRNCENCSDRQLGCHDNCEVYRELKHEFEERNKRYRQLNNTVEWNGYSKAMRKRRARI